jgi:cell wall-associated NlpC family hydrolase
MGTGMCTRRVLVTGTLLGTAALGLPSGRALADPLVTNGLPRNDQRISALSAEARDAVGQTRELAGVRRQARQRTEERLADVEGVLSGPTGAQRTELERLEQLNVDKTQKQPIASGGLGTPGSGALTPSAAGVRAVRYAYRQLGKPYLWGGQGPNSFDCSGLTFQAWASAGVVIPRVSQQQWRQLTRVPLDALRPGDLVIYFRGATHVAIYVGDGRVIQAPRPGGRVKISPIAANSPILGAVRPDGDDEPLHGAYGPPIDDGDDVGSDAVNGKEHYRKDDYGTDVNPEDVYGEDVYGGSFAATG